MDKLNIIKALDAKISKAPNIHFNHGWINTIRKSLNMPLEVLGNFLSLSRQGVFSIEKREQQGALTLKKMHQVAHALEMDFVYGFVPKHSLEALIERKAKEKALEIISKSDQLMKLEDQAVDKRAIKKHIKALADSFKKEVNPIIWK